MLASTLVRRSRALSRVCQPKFASIAVVGGYQQQQDSYGFGTAAKLAAALALTVGVAFADAKEDTKPTQKRWRTFTRKQVEYHNSLERNIWVTYKNGVYDVTAFARNHPGGKERLEGVAGQDIGEAWNLFRHHKSSAMAQQLLSTLKIGELDPSEVIEVPEDKHVPKYSADPVYDVIIVGAGLSGLQCGWSLINNHGADKSKILVLEAQDYVGGRVKQMTDFIKGTKVEVGAEFLHGNNTELTKFARANGEPLREIYCWAHGDGGPLPETADSGYGLYYVGATKANPTTTLTAAGDVTNLPYKVPANEVALNSRNRLLRYDDADPDFVALNKALWDLCDLDENDFDDSLSLYDYLIAKKLNPNMLKMGAAGFSNTLCANSYELSLKQAIKWSRIWHNEGGEDEEDGDYTFKNSYSSLVDHLSRDLQIEINTPIAKIAYKALSAPTAVPAITDAEGQGEHHSANTVDTTVATTTTTSGKESDSGEADTLVTVTTKDGTVYRARKIVVTASPHVINNKMIDFSPALPAEVAEAYTYTIMNPITKVIMKFKEPCWPKNLHGMIMVDDDFLLPEVWFRHVPDEAEEGEPTAYAVGFTTAKYTERLMGLSQDEVLYRCVKQLETVFSHLEQRHMDGDHPDSEPAPSALPKASKVYAGGMYWDWRPEHHPYIGGGYCSPRANRPITSGETLSKAYANGRLFFAGEATNDRPGATAHAALETGIRAAALVSAALKE